MKVLVVLLVLILSAGTANAALSLAKVDPDPANPDTCVRKSDNIKLKLDESQPGPGCSEITCVRFGTDGLALQTATCGSIANSDPKCKLIEDKSKPYSQCCPKIFCEN